MALHNSVGHDHELGRYRTLRAACRALACAASQCSAFRRAFTAAPPVERLPDPIPGWPANQQRRS